MQNNVDTWASFVMSTNNIKTFHIHLVYFKTLIIFYRDVFHKSINFNFLRK